MKAEEKGNRHATGGSVSVSILWGTTHLRCDRAILLIGAIVAFALSTASCGARTALVVSGDGGDLGVGGGGKDLATCTFNDGFESGTDRWVLGERWSESTLFTAEGATSLRGSWGDYDLGCPVTSSAKMNVDMNLVGASSATFSFSQFGEACSTDTLRILVSTDGGVSWTTASTPAALDTINWEAQTLDLGPWLGQPRVRFAFDFTNVCGDPCGVSWFVDRVAISCTAG